MLPVPEYLTKCHHPELLYLEVLDAKIGHRIVKFTIRFTTKATQHTYKVASSEIFKIIEEEEHAQWIQRKNTAC
jgi:hypothetical protein